MQHLQLENRSVSLSPVVIHSIEVEPNYVVILVRSSVIVIGHKAVARIA